MKLKMCVSLLPSDIGDIYAGIRRNIYQFLMRYNESLGGVLLAVSELSFGDGDGAAKEGRIEDEMPHIHFDVKAKAQVFRPQPGHVLEGRVNKVGGVTGYRLPYRYHSWRCTLRSRSGTDGLSVCELRWVHVSGAQQYNQHSSGVYNTKRASHARLVCTAVDTAVFVSYQAHGELYLLHSSPACIAPYELLYYKKIKSRPKKRCLCVCRLRFTTLLPV